ncbi:hypothetical protein HDV02_002799 [Globomyces sp. JEL0801]|nr:hypothetical protein HDV02_002799 [Globomyces sp. JEL0801]
MSAVAKALSRPPSYTTKFFGSELGTQTKLDDKNDRYIINGAHEAEKLQDLLDVFIEKFVLCASCKNPETEFEFTKDDVILKDCKACGAHLPADMRHRLATYILKNRPEVNKKKDKYRGKGDKVGTTENSDAEDGDPINGELEKEMNMLPTAEELQKDGEDDWAADTSEAAVAARMKDLSVSDAIMNKLLEKEDDDLKDPLDIFGDYVMCEPDLTNQDILDKALELELRADKVATVLPPIIFNDKIVTEGQIAQRAELLKHFLINEKAQKGFIGGIERLVGLSYPELLPYVSLILKDIYFEDLVEEEVLNHWGEKISKKYVEKKVSQQIHMSALPFINWLKEAEEESD